MTQRLTYKWVNIQRPEVVSLLAICNDAILDRVLERVAPTARQACHKKLALPNDL
jgi:hypothetical protein